VNILLMYSTHDPSEGHRHRLEGLGSGIQVSVASKESEAIALTERADVILGHRYLRQSLPAAQRLQWVQSTAGGVDRLPLRKLAAQDVTLTRTTIAAGDIARHALALAWAVTRRLPEAIRCQVAGAWEKDFDWLPLPRTSIVFGTGTIGTAIARRLEAEEQTVYGVKRTQKDPQGTPFDRFLTKRKEWLEILSEVDWCFLALPHTAETKELFDEAAIDELGNQAVVVNVGRGETLSTSALRRALENGRLGGAALDVIVPEPEGEDDPVWDTPRLLLTPYVAAHTATRAGKIERFCEAQVQRFLNDEPLQDQVDLRRCIGRT
jgi:phosphoglycerate dehydrogenase-like enzyme